MKELKNTNENSAEEQTKIIGKEQNNKSGNDIQAKIKEVTEMLDDKDLPF